jgi:hypothetical protein
MHQTSSATLVRKTTRIKLFFLRCGPQRKKSVIGHLHNWVMWIDKAFQEHNIDRSRYGGVVTVSAKCTESKYKAGTCCKKGPALWSHSLIGRRCVDKQSSFWKGDAFNKLYSSTPASSVFLNLESSYWISLNKLLPDWLNFVIRPHFHFHLFIVTCIFLPKM